MCAGIVRGIDNLGRVCIPKEITQTLGSREGLMEVWGGTDVDGMPCVFLRPYFPGCYLCGGSIAPETSISVHSRHVCLACAREVAARVALGGATYAGKTP